MQWIARERLASLPGVEVHAAAEIEKMETEQETERLTDQDFRKLERERREKDAEARLEELKKKMR